MKMARWMLCGFAALFLVAGGVLVWLLRADQSTGKEESMVVEEMRRAPDCLFAGASTNAYVYVDDVFRRIVKLPHDRPRKEYVQEFVNRVYSVELANYCKLKFENLEQQNETVVVYGGILKKLEHTAQRAFEALGRLRASKRERWRMYWLYLERYGNEERRLSRLCPRYDNREYLAWVRTYERKLLTYREGNLLTQEEYQGICADFEKSMGRRPRTKEELQQ